MYTFDVDPWAASNTGSEREREREQEENEEKTEQSKTRKFGSLRG